MRNEEDEIQLMPVDWYPEDLLLKNLALSEILRSKASSAEKTKKQEKCEMEIFHFTKYLEYEACNDK